MWEASRTQHSSRALNAVQSARLAAKPGLQCAFRDKRAIDSWFSLSLGFGQQIHLHRLTCIGIVHDYKLHAYLADRANTSDSCAAGAHSIRILWNQRRKIVVKDREVQPP